MTFYKKSFDPFTYSVLMEFISDKKLIHQEVAPSELIHLHSITTIDEILKKLEEDGYIAKTKKTINQKEYKYILTESIFRNTELIELYTKGEYSFELYQHKIFEIFKELKYMKYKEVKVSDVLQKLDCEIHPFFFNSVINKLEDQQFIKKSSTIGEFEKYKYSSIILKTKL